MSSRGISAGRWAAIVAMLALIVLFLPIPIGWQTIKASRAALAGSGIAVTGNSVISHVSSCDDDKRALPRMIGDAAGRAPSDMSFPGQPMEQGFDLARMALGNRRHEAVVLFLSLAQLADTGRASLQTQGFFRLAAGPYSANDIGARLRDLEPLTEGVRSQEARFTYRGIAYPAYDQIKTRYLLRERNAQRCPETLGQDRRFIEALYWANYLRSPLHPGYFDDLARISTAARTARRPLLIVLLPIDLDDVSALNPALATAFRARRDELLAQTRRRGVTLLDLSETVPADGFADRWCGCGHLQQAGRRIVAARVSAALSEATHAL